jgi:tetratricopeptide (TPR) repeat protein
VAVARGLDWVWPYGAAWAYRDALLWAPDEPELHFRRGAALGRIGRWRDAADSFGSAVRLRPRDIEYHGSLVVALHRADRSEELVEALRRLIEIRPDEGELSVLLGAVLLRHGRRAEALRVFRWAVRLSPGHESRRFVLGEALLGPRGWEDALDSWQSARNLDPKALPFEERGAARSVLHQHPGRRREWSPRPREALARPGLTARVRSGWGRLGAALQRSVVHPVTGDPRERRVRALRRAWQRAHPRSLRWPVVFESLRRRGPESSA